MKKTLASLAVAASLFAGANAFAQTEKPTIVLVHGAFADASSWNGVARILEQDGYTVVAAANPLRSVKSDAASVASLIASIQSPVVLVGHSYGGNVISAAANDQANVKALVYVSAFAPDTGETVAGLAGKFPGSTLGPTLAAPVPLSDGGKDLYIQQSQFHEQFAADVPAVEAALMAATQRPVTDAALNEPFGTPAWKHIPSWSIYGDQDKNIPPQALAFMAKRADAKAVEVVKGASHVVMVSHPAPVARLIERAATAK
ncbi:alpha/beta hydrolase [Pseudomonas sp. MUP55]|uniref:alpha/beta fold hydrolase n=1 Tax=Pseudomonas sp. MUP55 TaxID=3087234 RepID=UPI002A5A70B2|nr:MULTISPECIES: alpha/beta hydrolase [unclassified Pseudomonas]WPN95232.1 alpha/beta hydrolase [Pseudomonas sp. MUP56]WPO00760.1 alpha/beta hydrolase [Pseudomonas sp. MUP55]